MNVLILDSSFNLFQLAIYKNNQLASYAYNNSKGSQAERAFEYLEACLDQANLKTKDLDVIAINKGPGSFVGTRLSVSIAQGLATANPKLKVVQLSSLEMLANQLLTITNQDTNLQSLLPKFLLVAIDANMRECYAGLYKLDNGIYKLFGQEVLLGLSQLDFIGKLANGQITSQEFTQFIEQTDNNDFKLLGLELSMFEGNKQGLSGLAELAFIGNGYAKYNIPVQFINLDSSKLENLYLNNLQLNQNVNNQVNQQLAQITNLREQYSQYYRENFQVANQLAKAKDNSDLIEQLNKKLSENSLPEFLATKAQDYLSKNYSNNVDNRQIIQLDDYVLSLIELPDVSIQAPLLTHKIALKLFTPRDRKSVV